jgi:polyisoprenoid-binding protein YceI
MTRTATFTLGLVLALGAIGCKKETDSAARPAAETAPAADPTAVDTAPGKATPAPADNAAGAKPGSYKIDGVHSFVLFKIGHFGVGQAYGQFRDIAGSFKVDPDPTKSSVEVTLKTDSVDTHEAKRDAHLKSPDFFNAAQFPTITFKSTAIAAPGADGWADMTGDLTIRGKTKSVTLQVRPVGAAIDPMKTYRVGYEARGKINRMDFDVAFMAGALSDDVELMLAFEGVPAA